MKLVSRVCIRFLLLILIIVIVVKDEYAQARKRPKREPKCSLRISEDGRYKVVCARSKSLRKTSKINARDARKAKRIKKTNANSKSSARKNSGNLTPEQALSLARSSNDKRRNRLLICRDRSSKWVSADQFLSSGLAVNCNTREFLQGFSLQRQEDKKVRYKFTCCSFQ